jgi:hypothetical protein
MNKKKLGDNDFFENLYLIIAKTSKDIFHALVPYCRRFLRFIALPYCYFKLVNWEECNASHYQVLKDLLYVFFKFKYFPDNYSLCRLWEKDRNQWRYYYGSIYDPYQRGRLRKEVQKKEYEILFEDKNVCYQLCKAANLPLPMQYACIDDSDECKSIITNILDSNPDVKIIIKPVGGIGGRNIILAYKKNNRIIIKKKKEELSLEQFVAPGLSVLQEYIQQHEKLSAISPSTNTIRIITLLTKEREVLLIGAYMRFGIDEAYVDNVSSGGISIGIDIDKGVLKENAYDKRGRLYAYHPTSNFIFYNFEIPYWPDVLALAKKIQDSFFYYKLLGIDIAITPAGPIIIEINAAPDMVAMEQRYGPILANEKIRKAFAEYNLLINKLSIQ